MVGFASEAVRSTDPRADSRAFRSYLTSLVGPPVNRFAFQVHRDMRAGERSARKVAKAIGKSYTLTSHWCATYDWVARAAAWDAEQDRIALLAPQDEIERIHAEDIQLAEAMLAEVLKAVPRGSPQTRDQPHALQDWA